METGRHGPTEREGKLMGIRGRLASGVAVADIAVGAMACASSGDLEATQQNLAQTKSDLAAVTQRLSDLDGRLSTTQAELESADSALATSVTSLTDGQAEVRTSVASVGAALSDADERLTGLIGAVGTDLDGVKSDLAKTVSDVRTNESGIADAEDVLATARVDLDAVTAQSDDLKASFLLTRDDVAANAATIAAQGTRATKVERVALVAHLFQLWTRTSFLDTAIEGAVRQAVVAMEDPALESAWAAVPVALAVWAQVQSDETLQAYFDRVEEFIALLSRSLVDAYKAPAE
jgi:hypothetical protein